MFLAWYKEKFGAPVPPKWPVFTEEVGIGSSSQALVLEVTKRLVDLKFLGVSVSVFDKEVELAVKEFQGANSVGRTGKVGKQTWGAMFSDEAKSKDSHGGSGHFSKPHVDTNLVSECPNYASRNGVDIDTIILHNTEGSSGSAIARFQNSAEQVSAHFIVDRDGELIQMVDESMTAWHSGSRPTNQRSIGIEIVAGGGMGIGMTDIQQGVVVELLKYLMEAYDVAAEYVLPHRHIVSTSCPGSIWKTDADLENWKRAHIS